MGSKYTTQSASGYNSSPPPDDGSQSASNLISWATHKTKLGDPVKNLADSINTALITAFDYSVRQINSSDSVAASDHMKTVEIAPTVTTAVTVTLADAATMTSNFLVRIKNSSAINQTIARATGGDTIDGSASSITIPPLSSIYLGTTAGAAGYLILGKTGPFVDSDALICGSADGTKKVRFEVDGLTTGTTRVVTVPDADFTIAKASDVISAAPITNSLSGDVSLNNTANYFDGPSVAQGSTGTWFVSGTVTLVETSASPIFDVKLWDGTTVIASTKLKGTASAGNDYTVSLSGYLATPAGNLRISVKDETSTGGKIAFNSSGNSKDSTITAFRIA